MDAALRTLQESLARLCSVHRVMAGPDGSYRLLAVGREQPHSLEVRVNGKIFEIDLWHGDFFIETVRAAGVDAARDLCSMWLLRDLRLTIAGGARDALAAWRFCATPQLHR